MNPGDKNRRKKRLQGMALLIAELNNASSIATVSVKVSAAKSSRCCKLNQLSPVSFPPALQFAINAISVALPDQVKNLCGMRTNTSSNWLSDADYLDPSSTTPNISQAVGTSSFDTHYGQAGVSVMCEGVVHCSQMDCCMPGRLSSVAARADVAGECWHLRCGLVLTWLPSIPPSPPHSHPAARLCAPPPPVHHCAQALLRCLHRPDGPLQLQHHRLAHQGQQLHGRRTHPEPGLLRLVLGVHDRLCRRDSDCHQASDGPFACSLAAALALHTSSLPLPPQIPPQIHQQTHPNHLLCRYKSNVVQLSPQALVDCFFGPPSNQFYGCQGGDLPIFSIRWTSGVNAWKLPTNAAYPYTATTGNCNTALLSNSGMTVYGWVDGASACAV